MELITSTANPLIKHARALTERKQRRRSGEFFVEGLQPTGRALEAGWDVRRLIVCDELLTQPAARASVDDARERGIAVSFVSASVFATLSERDGPTGLAAIVAMPQRTLADVGEGTVVALDRASNPGNLGTIIRTADAAGAAGVVLLDESTDPYAPAAVKASMGSVFAVPVVPATSEQFAAWAGERRLPLVATSGYAAVSLWETELPQPCALLMGNEGDGLPQHWLDRADLRIKIPMTGTAESLNLAVATGVALYAIQRPVLG